MYSKSLEVVHYSTKALKTRKSCPMNLVINLQSKFNGSGLKPDRTMPSTKRNWHNNLSLWNHWWLDTWLNFKANLFGFLKSDNFWSRSGKVILCPELINSVMPLAAIASEWCSRGWGVIKMNSSLIFPYFAKELNNDFIQKHLGLTKWRQYLLVD